MRVPHCRAHHPLTWLTPPPSTSQCPDKHQKYISHVLGVPMHKVVVRTKRLGELAGTTHST